MRRLLTPGMLGLHVFALATVVAMTVLGLWQLRAYDDRQASAVAEKADARPVTLDEVLGPNEAFSGEAHGRPVRVAGTYGAPQLLVTREGAAPWLVTPLRTDSGSAVLVVRGQTDNTTGPPAGRVTVVGSLQPTEPRAADTGANDARVSALNIAQLVGRYDADLYSGFVVLTEQTPPSNVPLADPPEPEVSATTGLRNLMYALQWWVFALFGVFMWWRIVRERATPRERDEARIEAPVA